LRQSISRYQTLQYCWYVSLQSVLELVGHNRTHDCHAHCGATGAKEGEAGCDFAKLPLGECILNNDREEAHHYANTQTGY